MKGMRYVQSLSFRNGACLEGFNSQVSLAMIFIQDTFACKSAGVSAVCNFKVWAL
jgi:hypothetical protein